MTQKVRKKKKTRTYRDPKDRGFNSSEASLKRILTELHIRRDRAPVWPLRFSFLSRTHRLLIYKTKRKKHHYPGPFQVCAWALRKRRKVQSLPGSPSPSRCCLDPVAVSRTDWTL